MSIKNTFAALTFKAWTFASRTLRGGAGAAAAATYFYLLEGPSQEYLVLEGPSQEYLVLESLVSVELLDWRVWEDGVTATYEDGTSRTWEELVGGTTSGGYFIPIEGPPR